jgi:hypothetical protein
VRVSTCWSGKDLRVLPLVERKAKLAKLLARGPVGIVFNDHTDEDGALVFRARLQDGPRRDRVEAAREMTLLCLLWARLKSWWQTRAARAAYRLRLEKDMRPRARRTARQPEPHICYPFPKYIAADRPSCHGRAGLSTGRDRQFAPAATVGARPSGAWTGVLTVDLQHS